MPRRLLKLPALVVRVARAYKLVLTRGDTSVLEMVLATISIIQGALFWSQPQALRFPAFEHFTTLLNHWQWGLILCLSGCWEIYVVGVDSRYRSQTAFLMSVLWIFLAMMVLTTYWDHPNGYNALIRSMCSGWVYLRRRESIGLWIGGTSLESPSSVQYLGASDSNSVKDS